MASCHLMPFLLFLLGGGSLGGLVRGDPVACEDELLNCQEVADGGACYGGAFSDASGRFDFNYGLAVQALTHCRASCRRRARRDQQEGTMTPEQSLVYNLTGGADDVMVSLVGGRISVCDLRDGWTASARKDIILRRLLAAAFYHQKIWNSLQRYTQEGFKVTKVPEQLWKGITEFYQSAKEDSWLREEPCLSGIFICEDATEGEEECTVRDVTTMLYYQISRELELRIGEELKPLAEEWIGGGHQLVFNNAHGIRRYLRGGRCGVHTDTYTSRVISAIINVGQDAAGHPWPLDILGYDGEAHKVFLSPGEMVWYESARLPHGREATFRGKYFDNLFVHYYPA